MNAFSWPTASQQPYCNRYLAITMILHNYWKFEYTESSYNPGMSPVKPYSVEVVQVRKTTLRFDSFLEGVAELRTSVISQL